MGRRRLRFVEAKISVETSLKRTKAIRTYNGVRLLPAKGVRKLVGEREAKKEAGKESEDIKA